MTRPEDLHPALVAAINAGNVEALIELYDSNAVFIIKPGQVTQGPAELRAALERIIGRRSTIAIEPHSFTRSGDVVLAVGTYKLSGHRRDDSPFEVVGRFADILRLDRDGRWRLAVDNGFADA